jgi:peptidoglycan/LPS O-acetylase OafA/YrhL
MVEHLDASMLHGLAVLIMVFLCISVYLPTLGFPINFELMISPWMGIFLLGYYFTHPVSMKYRKWYYLLGIAAFCFSIFLCIFFPQYQSLLTAPGSPTLVFIGGAVFLLLKTMENCLPKPGFLINFLIRHSYSILLVHWACLYIVKDGLGITADTYGMAGSALLSFVLIFLLSVITSFLYDQTIVLCIQTIFKKLFYSSDS